MKYLLLSLKIIITLTLIYLALRGVDFAYFQQTICSKVGVITIVFSIVIMLMQIVLAGIRLKPILEVFKQNFQIATAIKLGFLGSFFSQFMFSFIGGDAIRVFALKRIGITTHVAMQAIFLDRVLGFVALQILFLISLPCLLNILSSGSLYWGIVAIAWFSIILILSFVMLGFMHNILINIKILKRFLFILTSSRYIFKSNAKAAEILLISFLIQFCNIFAIYVITNILGGEITLLNSFVIGLTVMLLTMLPISIGGWGVRENCMVIGLNLIGISSDIAITVSLMIGVGGLISSLPGAFGLFSKNKEESMALTI